MERKKYTFNGNALIYVFYVTDYKDNLLICNDFKFFDLKDQSCRILDRSKPMLPIGAL